MPLRRYLPLLFLLLFVVALQLLLTATGRLYYLTQLTMSVYYSLVVIGLCLLMGYAGQISLGHAGFFAIGGYVSAVLTTYNLVPYAETSLVKGLRWAGLLFERHDLYGERILAVSPWAAFAAAIGVSVAAAFIIGIPVIRPNGHYLAMATMGFGTIVYQVVAGTPIFGEADGISEVPPFSLPGGLQVDGRLPYRVENYYLAWFLVFAAILLSINLVHSRVGRALRSIHENEEAANALGVDTVRYKLYTFVLSAVMAAAGGVFLTHYNGGIAPSEASALKSVRYVAIVAAGGMANIWGALLCAVILNFLSLRGVFGSYDEAVFGLILITIMIFAPHEILGTFSFRNLAARLKEKIHGTPAS